jgi:crotonobetainyl-CoA:carnitine CoA-transferase CaiB-like acyl-CoA transferase
MAQQPPLTGIKVLDFSQMLAGPYCTMMLADMGADVVKIERPGGGDDTRRMGPPFINGESAAFLAINRNKRSMVLDLKSPEGVEVARRMAKTADVLVQNMRPGTMDRLGLGYEGLSASNEGLVYCSISGFGLTGPYKGRAGFDLVAQGMSGLMSVTGFPGSPPAKVGVPITDLNAGMFAANAILSAYVHRLKTGEGQHVDTSLLEAGLSYTIWESAIYFATGRAPGPLGSGHPLNAPYQAFTTSDGYINIGAANQANWERMCRAIDRDELLDDPRFATNADRMGNLASLVELLQETFATRSTDEWIEVLLEAGVPTGPILDIAQVYADPQVKAREMAVELDHPSAGRITNIGIAAKLSRTPGSLRTASPTLGQHTDEVLTEYGYADDAIARMRAGGVLG